MSILKEIRCEIPVKKLFENKLYEKKVLLTASPHFFELDAYKQRVLLPVRYNLSDNFERTLNDMGKRL